MAKAARRFSFRNGRGFCFGRCDHGRRQGSRRDNLCGRLVRSRWSSSHDWRLQNDFLGWFLSFPCPHQSRINLRSGRSIFLSRSRNHFLPSSPCFCFIHFLWQGNREVEIKIASFNTGDGLANLQVFQVLRHKEGKTFGELLGIRVADPEDDAGGRMGHDCAPHVGVAL